MLDKELLKRTTIKTLEEYKEKVLLGCININYPNVLEKEILNFLKMNKNKNELILCQYYCAVIDGKVESSENYNHIFNVMHDLALKNNVLAQERLGYMYQFFKDYSDDDYKEALFWYLKAAEQEYDVAEFNVGCFYETGKGIKQNFQKAFYWYLKAAEQDNADAQYNLALLYYNGLGIEKNPERAKYWCKKALENGNALAKKFLSTL